MEGPQRFLSVFIVATFLLILLILSVSENTPSLTPPLYVNNRVNNRVRKILFWTAFFRDKDWKHVTLGDHCGVQCTFSTDRKDPLAHDALIFHGRNPHSPPKERTPEQVYIMLLFESPDHRGDFVEGDSFYNWSATYARKSDVFMPYFSLSRITNPRDSVIVTVNSLPQLTHKRTKDKAMIAWVVSNCGTPGKRKQYVNKLKTYMKVHTYGACGMRCPFKNCLKGLAKTGRYKFYLSFENSVCKDYITEKALRPLQGGLLPIVYGGMAADDYKVKLPPRSFIDVRNYKSPKHLSEYLKYLDDNTTAYLEYFKWRRTHMVSGRSTWCDLCQALNNDTILASKRNINWDTHWNSKTDCDGSYLKKVLGPDRR